MTPEAIARVCHEANRALQVEHYDETIGVAPHWSHTTEEMQASVIDGVRQIIDQGLTPRESHANWARFKREHGWIYGPVKSEQEKTHPNLVDYDDLPEDERLKDELFGAVVRALA